MKPKRNMMPFVKWVGGKGQLLEKLNLIIPKDVDRIVEPFVGGGAFFIQQEKPAIVNDINKELIITYETIKNEPKKLQKQLKKYEKDHSKEFFLNLRKEDYQIMNNIDVSSRFIYLNKSGFNGMYRVNSKGEFNVPFGQKEKVNIFNPTNINKLHEFFNSNNIEFHNEDYVTFLKNVKKNDLVFIDPPYDKESENSFTLYSKDQFNRKEQEQLVKEIKILNKKGIKFILTNSNTDFIKENYKEFNQIEVSTNRMINSNEKKRMDAAKELIIFNFEISKETLKEFQFLAFIEGMRITNKRLDKLTDWEKIWKHQESRDYDLNQFNYLITDSLDDFKKRLNFLYQKTISSFSILPILLATREESLYVYDVSNNLLQYNFKNPEKLSYEEIEKFFIETGLSKLFISGIKNINDYSLGIETGLDSNARKNRSGKAHEELIRNLLDKYNVKYDEQSSIEINGKKNINNNRKEHKKFDFVFTIKKIRYLAEVNFYNTSGSKLDAISKDYIKLNNDIKEEKNSEFIWITDGQGWTKHKNSIKTAFFSIDNLFNTKMFEAWLIKKLK